MANPHKGETNLEVGNVVYSLVFDWDALCSIENDTGKPIGQLATDLTQVSRWRATDARTVLYYGLRKNHPNITIKQAGEMVRQAGGLTKLAPVLNVAIAVAFPEALTKDDQSENPTEPIQRESIGSGS